MAFSEGFGRCLFEKSVHIIVFQRQRNAQYLFISAKMTIRFYNINENCIDYYIFIMSCRLSVTIKIHRRNECFIYPWIKLIDFFWSMDKTDTVSTDLNVDKKILALCIVPDCSSPTTAHVSHSFAVLAPVP